jgi:tetratricopeptide (TPR) repeat protein
MAQGDLAEAERAFIAARELFPGNADALQRLCELSFLRNQPRAALAQAEAEIELSRTFWGMLGCGLRWFETCCQIQAGDGEQPVNLPDKVNPRDDTQLFIMGLRLFSRGEYDGALVAFDTFEREYVNFEIQDSRLALGRAMVLAGRDEATARFLFEDIAANSLTRRHLARLSTLYLKMGEGNPAAAARQARPAFVEVMDKAGGDFHSRFWLFYDAYIYALIMEHAGDHSEAARGYQACIDANPHTDLARRSRAALSRAGE